MIPAGAWIHDLRAQRRRDGAPWVDSPTPSLSWWTEVERTPGPGAGRAWAQASARLELTRPDRGGTVERAQVEGDGHLGVPWPFAPLAVGERVRLRVELDGVDGSRTAAAAVELELPPSGAEWGAEWICLPAGTPEEQPGQFRCTFVTRPDAEVVRARLHLSALGACEAELDGVRVGDEVLSPGWTSYADRVLARTHDVTGLVRAGRNVLGVWLAGAWFTERYGFFGRAQRAHTGPPALLARLDLTYDDGGHQVVTTGPDWRCSTEGPLRRSGIYAGEEFDATRSDPTWTDPRAVEPGSWNPVARRSDRSDVPTPRVEAAAAEPVRRTRLVAPVGVRTTPAGHTVVDFGQNLVGRVRVRVRGPRGHRITLRHAEVLEDGEIATRQLRFADAVDVLVLAGPVPGEEFEEFEPRFTFHGFRYLQVDDWPGPFDAAAVTAVVCHSDLLPTARFTCSDTLLERLHENVVWSTRGNFLSIPTDCPQRDERLGWTGDLQVFSATATTLFDVSAFLASWLRDLAADQERAGGVVPLVVPAVMPEADGAVAGWGDAAVVVPWRLYERYGDVDVLARQYDSMRAWTEVVLGLADEDGLWTSGYQLGDWLDPAAPADRPREGRTKPWIVASAQLYRTLDVLARTARLLGQDTDAERYTTLAERTRTSFLETCVTPRGLLVSDGPTAYALALEFALVREEPLRQALGRRLAAIVREDGYRIGTGFIGTPLVLDALCSTGHTREAGRLLRQTRFPSWLYPVTLGATTVWERWDALLPDGSVNPDDMTSFNHYAFGAVADWLHRGLAGLGAAEPGWRTLRIAPVVIDGVTHAASEQLTPQGPAAVSWNVDERELVVQAVVPTGTTATVSLPGRDPFVVGAGEHRWTTPWLPTPEHHPPRDLDTDVADLVDDPEALDLVVETLSGYDPGRAAGLRQGTRFERGVRLRDVLLFADPAGLRAVEDALTSLGQTRTGAKGPGS